VSWVRFMATSVATAAIGFAGFNGALMAGHLLAVPPQLHDPACSQYLGRWLYLTYQSNVIGTAYFALALCDAVLLKGTAALLVFALFPLVFAMGAFLTIAYYALDHFNAENLRRKERHRAQYPYVHWCSHIEHGHALPLLLLHAVTMKMPLGAVLPTNSEVVYAISAYMIFYLLLIHINWWATGLWPYAVIDDVTRVGGLVLRCGFFACLTGLFVAFGFAGVALFNARSQ